MGSAHLDQDPYDVSEHLANRGRRLGYKKAEQTELTDQSSDYSVLTGRCAFL